MPDIRHGAANAIHVCLAVGSQDRVVILTDRAREHIGHALAAECELAEAPTKLLVIEDFVERPAKLAPEHLVQEVDDFKPTVSIYAATGQPGELQFRGPLTRHWFTDLRTRHGHMINIDDQVMEEGMSSDYEKIAAITIQVTEIVREARDIEVQAPSGTDLRARMDPGRLRWVPCTGLIHEPGAWSNLPDGETFTSPAQVDGVLGGEVLGDHFSERYGVLPEPMLFEIGNSRIKRIVFPYDDVRTDVERYMTQHENSNRAGEFAIGTNVGLKKLSGNLLQDEKIPGLHIAFGHPYTAETGADWDAPSHCDVVSSGATIKVDGQLLMRDGEFVF
ncbi:MAG: aminopeptidase [Chloroflexota bacterium]|jgi:leucyl aminopeptidase (aminopeptidase T)|nr:aminopeptidase [Chloroflexota bacterium]